MRERGHGERFPLETCENLRVLRDGHGQNLDRHILLEFGSRARNTSPIPPAPIGATISYGPSRLPAVKVIVGGNDTPGFHILWS